MGKSELLNHAGALLKKRFMQILRVHGSPKKKSPENEQEQDTNERNSFPFNLNTLQCPPKIVLRDFVG